MTNLITKIKQWKYLQVDEFNFLERQIRDRVMGKDVPISKLNWYENVGYIISKEYWSPTMIQLYNVICDMEAEIGRLE